MQDMLEKIDNKTKKIKIYKVFDLFIRSILTLGGTVSLISILMFLNSRFGVSYFSCLLITCFVPSLYSLVVNYSLEGFDKKIKMEEYELAEMENEYDCIKKMLEVKEDTKDSVIEKIELRFDGLSNERKLELLSYIRNIIPDSSYSQYMSDLDNLEFINLDDTVKEIYSRKKEK